MYTFDKIISRHVIKEYNKLVVLFYKKQKERLQRILVESKLRQEIREDFL